MQAVVNKKVTCYHCGDECRTSLLCFDDKTFCCEGCRLVYDVLQENGLCSYYRFNETPGQTSEKPVAGQFGYLDDPDVKRRLMHFDEGDFASVTFYVPRMHCSSCIWLLENLQRINPGVLRSRVNFLTKKVSVVFKKGQVSLRALVELLSMIGYEPLIRLDDLEDKKPKKKDRSPIYKIGVAGFAFGNIMLFSFPEYFSISDATDPGFSNIFSYVNFGLSLPVFFYCSSQFFLSAWQSIHQKFLNIDVPIALGILVMFLRSSFEIFTRTGPGYMDTMAGLVFFMLVGRWFQDKTYETLSFDRDYKSFFPVSVMVRRDSLELSIPLSELRIGDRILIRNEEIIPADAVLLKGDASIDYSFVTGESDSVSKEYGELIFAGGRQKGAMLELEVNKVVSQSYLTQLWNNDRYVKKQDDTPLQQLVNRISHYFTVVIVAVSLVALLFWAIDGNWLKGWNAFTAVLIIACPCALAISSPFTLGNILRVFGSGRFYIRGYPIIEKLANADTIIFDKTGTLTRSNKSSVFFDGEKLNRVEESMVYALYIQSTHPLSRILATHLATSHKCVVEGFEEFPGKGLQGRINTTAVKIGSANFVGVQDGGEFEKDSRVYVRIGQELKGFYVIKNEYREGLNELAAQLRSANYHLVVLTGDNDHEYGRLKNIFGRQSIVKCRQSPADKLNVVQQLQSEGRSVLMIGDGLNDAGALKQADVGISISEDVNNFSPACDGILEGAAFARLYRILLAAKASRSIIIASFAIALIYNFIGCWYAVQGSLSPVIAAVLMPLSTVTIISFTTGASNFAARKAS